MQLHRVKFRGPLLPRKNKTIIPNCSHPGRREDEFRYLLTMRKNYGLKCRVRPPGRREGDNLFTNSKYEPTVSVSTKKSQNSVIVTVSDNGNVIPQNIVDKIFQPCFTTKPGGIGTGLGLSLSYDIVKAHGGEIKVESKEGEGSQFIIQLPVV